MEVNTLEIKGNNGIKIKGEIDMHTSPEAHKVLMEEIDKLSDGESIVVDMSEVDYMDSSGIATFVDGLRHVKKKKGDMILYNPSPKIQDVFSIAKLESVFKIERDN